VFVCLYFAYSKWEQQEQKKMISQKLKLLTETFNELKVRETPDGCDKIPS
jgi:hypothetical protein